MKLSYLSVILFSIVSSYSAAAQQAHIEGKAGETSLFIENSGHHGIFIDSTEDNGITIFNPSSFGIQINNAGLHGINITEPIVNGLLVASAGFDGVSVSSPTNDGLHISNAGNNGLYLNNTANTGIEIDSATTGLLVDRTSGTGIILNNIHADGIGIYNAAQHGIIINNSGIHGIRMSNPAFIGYHVVDPGLDGFFVSNAGDDGLEISGGQRGVHVHDVMGYGGYFHNDATSTSAPLYLQRGNDALMDVEFSGHARLTSNGAFIFYMDDNNNGTNQFEVVDSDLSTLFQVYESGNAYIKNQLRILNSNANALRIENSAGDGLNILNAGQDGVEISGGVNGVYAHDVTSRAGHFHNASSSILSPLFVSHGDDTQYDLSFGGHALISSNGNYNITLDANNNAANDYFSISRSNGDAIFIAYETNLETAVRGPFTAWGNIKGLSDADFDGMLSKGGGTFKIDHPLDPKNKYLYHSFVESPDMMNVYNGNSTTNEACIAIIELPNYFEALNRDFRYQLTTIGSFAQVMVKEELSNNQFVIQSSEPNIKVSWQITGIRRDPFANENRVKVEVEKTGKERGTILHKKAYEQSTYLAN